MSKGRIALIAGAMALCAVGILVFLGILQESGKVSSSSIEDVSSAVTSVTDLAPMSAGDDNMIRRLYGIDPGEFDGAVLYYPGSAAVANELLIVKLASTGQQDAVKQAIESRLVTETGNFNGYGVGQYEMLQSSVIDISGNYVLFVVSENPGEVDAAFKDAL